MILVTGGTGLLGSHLLLALLKNGEKVKSLYRSESSINKTKQIFSYYNETSLFELINWVKGDVTDHFSLEDALHDVKEVYHGAAVVSFAPGADEVMYQINMQGTANLINACLTVNPGIRFYHVSSVAALGKPRTGKADEVSGWSQNARNSAYAVSKFASEQEVWRGFEEGLSGFIVNPSVIIGPGNFKTDSSQIFSIVDNGIKFYPPGATGYVGVWDVVNAMLFLSQKKISNESYVLNSEDLSFQHVLSSIAHALNKPAPKFKLHRITAIIAMYAETVIKGLVGKKRVLSGDLINALMDKSTFSSDKIESLGFKFEPVEQAITRTAAIYKSSKAELPLRLNGLSPA